MILTKKALSRRTVLRGAGAAVALPLLDAMIPALAPAAASTPVRRFGVVYHPNGIIYDKWLPKGEGANFELSPTLKGLESFKDQVTVITGLASDQAEALGDGGGDHSRACGSFLTGVHVKKSDTNVENAVSMDQIAAKAFERDTQLSSLQMGVDDNSLLGSCDLGYSCAYSATLSWLTPTLPLMAENNPRVLFERMFGSSDSTDARVRASRLNQDRSLIDSVNDRVRQLQRKLGSADNSKVNDYLEALRDVERRIQKAEEQSSKEIPDVAQPAGIPDTFVAHVRLLYDLQLLAYQSDLTRVITFMYGREQTGGPIPKSACRRRIIPSHTTKATRCRWKNAPAFSGITSSCSPSTSKSCVRLRMAMARCSITRSFCSARESAIATGTLTALYPSSWSAEARVR